jgi:RNA polymerase sigma-70 factor (ECF subfamily)
MGKLLTYRRPADTAEEMSDEALLAACATGDAAGLAALFRRHNAAVYRFLSRMAGVDDRDLDDLVQATFLAVRDAAARYRGGSSVRTWVFAIALNVARNHVRAEIRRRGARSNLEELAPSPGPALDALVDQRQALARVEAALSDLPHDLRAAFVLCALEGIPGREAAEVLGVRQGTLWRRVFEARTRLRDALEGRARR